MELLLRKIYAAQDWKTDPSKSPERARYYRDILRTQHLSPHDQLVVRRAFADELLSAGDNVEAVEQLEQARSLIQATGNQVPADFQAAVRQRLAIAYLRLGEQENCQNFHGQRSCIFPIRGSGVHTLKRGSEGAVRILTESLDKDPHDLLSRWLLNIAYMTLGEYPQAVPAKWLASPALFASESNPGTFLDVAPQAGLAAPEHAGGVLMEDFDGDGFLDIMLSSSGPLDPMHFFHNNGDGTFSDRTAAAGLSGELGGLNLICADYDNDGHPDVVVLRGGWWEDHGAYPLSLLHNNGDGTFDDATVRAGLLSLHPTQTAAWADFDNDGWLDLYVGHESKHPGEHPSQLFHNNHDGTFTDVAAANGLADLGFVKGVAWGDFNNDGRPDLYISVKGASNHLFRNDGPRDKAQARPDHWKFTDITAQAGVADPKESFATWFFDYDNDGWPDLFVAGYSTTTMADVGAFELGKPFHAELPRLYRNNHNGTFGDVTAQVHLDRAIIPMGANFGDLDNDGWLDIYLGTGEPAYEALLPNRMFRNDGGRRFQDVTTDGGFGHLQKGHGVAFGDIENNGHEDILEEMGGALPGDTYTPVLYRNPGNSNHWLTLELQGTKTNRSAIGARVLVTLAGPSGRRIYRTVGYGSSFGGNPLRQHIGLGPSGAIADVEIIWPVSATVQHFRGLAKDSAYRIIEGDNTPQLLHLRQFTFPLSPDTQTPMSMPMRTQGHSDQTP